MALRGSPGETGCLGFSVAMSKLCKSKESSHDLLGESMAGKGARVI